MAESLYDKYGGFDTLSTVVTNFYDKILDNDKLQFYFKGIDMNRLISHQTKFMAKVLGSPHQDEGSDLKKAHARFKITSDHFNEVAELLEETLDEAGFEEADIETIIGVVASVKDQIVIED